MQKIKVSKKIEKMCRAMAIDNLLSINFPPDLIDKKVEESWPAYFNTTKNILKIIKTINNGELKGETTIEEINKE
jgi:hypothetical protein